MKKKCLVCQKDKKINYKLSLGQDLCVSCLKLSPSLKEQVLTLDNVYLKEATTPQELHDLTQEQEAARILLSKSIEEQQGAFTAECRMGLMQQGILNKVQELYLQEKKEIIPKEMMTKIQKTVGEFNSFHLEECYETIESATSFDDIRKHISLRKLKDQVEIPDPRSLYERIIKGVVDQDHAARTIASAIVKHYCRLKDPKIKKQNIFILGPTGTGKTELVRTLAKEINIPLVTVDATSLTASGYRGNTASELIVSSLLKATNHDMNLAKYSIVFIDEIDKKAQSNGNGSEIGTLNVQHELLKMVEGGIIHTEIVNPITNQRQEISLDTSNILFIVAGAFSGLEKIINAKNTKKVGLTSSSSPEFTQEDFSGIDNRHLMQFGLIPEFIGRFSIITYTKQLTMDSLIKILNKSEGLTEQYRKTFAQFKCEINFSTEFLEEIAQEALAQNIGARGLERIFERKMENLFFNVYEYIGEKIIVQAGAKIGQRKKINQPKETITF